jgi:hypothetical protein
MFVIERSNICLPLPGSHRSVGIYGANEQGGLFTADDGDSTVGSDLRVTEYGRRKIWQGTQCAGGVIHNTEMCIHEARFLARRGVPTKVHTIHSWGRLERCEKSFLRAPRGESRTRLGNCPDVRATGIERVLGGGGGVGRVVQAGCKRSCLKSGNY